MKIVIRITKTANVILVMLFLSLKCHLKLLPMSLKLSAKDADIQN